MEVFFKTNRTKLEVMWVIMIKSGFVLASGGTIKEVKARLLHVAARMAGKSAIV